MGIDKIYIFSNGLEKLGDNISNTFGILNKILCEYPVLPQIEQRLDKLDIIFIKFCHVITDGLVDFTFSNGIIYQFNGFLL